MIGRCGLVLQDDLLYQDLVLMQPNGFGEVVDMCVTVPETWMDKDGIKALLPHPTFHIGGMYPHEWSEPLFNRRRYPNVNFVEYTIHDFLFASPGNKV